MRNIYRERVGEALLLYDRVKAADPGQKVELRKDRLFPLMILARETEKRLSVSIVIKATSPGNGAGSEWYDELISDVKVTDIQKNEIIANILKTNICPLFTIFPLCNTIVGIIYKHFHY